MEVREVPAIETLALRRQVLGPHQTIDELAREDDHGRGAVYFAALDGGAVIGTASVHREAPQWDPDEPDAWRLRGMATEETRRGRGVGTAVLSAVVECVRARGGGLLWCNARVPAVDFYRGLGFTTRGESWEEPMIGPHVAMHRLIEPINA